MVNKNYWHFRPTNILDSDKIKIKAVAASIAKKAKYGIGRAIRLAIASSSFGSGAKKRLEKYQDRFKKMIVKN